MGPGFGLHEFPFRYVTVRTNEFNGLRIDKKLLKLLLKVSLANYRFHPDCDDLVTVMSGRVRPSSQGRGLGTVLKSPIATYLRKGHPAITRIVADTLYTPNIEAKMKKWKLLYHWVSDLSSSFTLSSSSS